MTLPSGWERILHAKLPRINPPFDWITRDPHQIMHRLAYAHSLEPQVLHTGDKLLHELLLQIYGRCGSVADARRIFSQIPHPNVSSWNMLIAAYAKNGHLSDAKNTFDRMPCRDSVSSNTMIWASRLVCNPADAKHWFDQTPERTLYSWNSLVSANAQRGHLSQARTVFDRMPARDAVSWNAILSSCLDDPDAAEGIFHESPIRSIASWSSVIRAVIAAGKIPRAEEIFDRMPAHDAWAWNAIIAAHGGGGGGDASAAKSAFDRMPGRDVVAWSSIIHALLRCSRSREIAVGEAAFERMPARNAVAWTMILLAGSQRGDIAVTKSIFDAMPQRDLVAWNALITAHGDRYRESKAVFDRMPAQGIVSWNCLITSMSLGKDSDSARVMFDAMPQLDRHSLAAIITAYAQNGRLDQAHRIFQTLVQEPCQERRRGGEHRNLVQEDRNLVQLDQEHRNLAQEHRNMDPERRNLVQDLDQHDQEHRNLDNLDQERRNLDRDHQRSEDHQNLLAWNAIIAAHAQFGSAADAMSLLRELLLEGSSLPSDESFLGAMNGCAHAGLVEETRSVFVALVGDFGMVPRLEHYCCVMESLGRVGELDRAEEVMAAMPCLPDEVAWVGFVGIFRIHGQVGRAVAAAQRFVQENPRSATAQVLRSVVLRWAASGNKI